MTPPGTGGPHGQSNWTGQLRMNETQRFLLLSMLIGIFAGLLVVCFHVAIDFVSWFTLSTPAGQDILRTILWPAVGATAASLLLIFFFRAAQGSGVNHTKAAIYISDGRVPFSTVVGKFVACSVSIGSGNSLGPEDPALQMGAGVASLLGRAFRLTRETMRMIAPVGAAAGIGAAFNTPITAVLFVMEEVLGGWRAGVLGSIVLAAVSAVVVNRSFLGNEPLFRVPALDLAHSSELFVYAAIGVASGLLSAVFVRSIARLRRRLEGLPWRSRYFLPGAAGLFVGSVGVFLPQVMGAGYEAIDAAMHNQYPWEWMAAMCMAKILVTMACFSAGTPGGMFAPTLFIGAMLGGGFGALAHLYWPFPVSPIGAYVLVGMGTFFAGVFRAPMTSIFMVFEVSATYVIILPVMIANTVSYLISRAINKTPFFETLARQEGLDLPSAEEQRERRVLRVEDAMSAKPPRVINALTLASHALERLTKEQTTETLITVDWRHWGVLHRAELEAAVAKGRGQDRLEDIFEMRELPRVYPDLPLDSAMRMVGSHEVLPVLNRANQHQIMGTLTLADIHKAYGIAQKIMAKTPAE